MCRCVISMAPLSLLVGKSTKRSWHKWDPEPRFANVSISKAPTLPTYLFHPYPCWDPKFDTLCCDHILSPCLSNAPSKKSQLFSFSLPAGQDQYCCLALKCAQCPSDLCVNKALTLSCPLSFFVQIQLQTQIQTQIQIQISVSTKHWHRLALWASSFPTLLFQSVPHFNFLLRSRHRYENCHL